MNQLLKRQGKLNTESKDIRNLKKKLMKEIVPMVNEVDQQGENSKLNKQIGGLTEQIEENRIAFEVMDAFYRLCFDKKMYELAVEQRKLSERYHDQMLEYVDLGMRSSSDLQEVKARLQSDIYQETVKANGCRLSLLALKELLNMRDTDTLAISPGGRGAYNRQTSSIANNAYFIRNLTQGRITGKPVLSTDTISRSGTVTAMNAPSQWGRTRHSRGSMR